MIAIFVLSSSVGRILILPPLFTNAKMITTFKMQNNPPLHLQIIHPLLSLSMLRTLLDVLLCSIDRKMVKVFETAPLS
jgi:hypothetical protein